MLIFARNESLGKVRRRLVTVVFQKRQEKGAGEVEMQVARLYIH